MKTHKVKHDHELFENSLFSEIPLLKKLKTKAFKQLGTSGGGNHFVEFGEVTMVQDQKELGLEAGNYVGLLSHSGFKRFRC